jgi:hypothetical protein
MGTPYRTKRGLRVRNQYPNGDADMASIWRTTHRDGRISVNIYGNSAFMVVPLGELFDALGITLEDCQRAFSEKGGK